MRRNVLDYRELAAMPKPRAWRATAALCAGAALLIASLAWCIATWNTPGRLILLPAGEGTMGFRSYRGWLEWVEYTDWDKKEYPSWSVPWAGAVLLELSGTAYVSWRRPRADE